jgi:hypothetical protein
MKQFYTRPFYGKPVLLILGVLLFSGFPLFAQEVTEVRATDEDGSRLIATPLPVIDLSQSLQKEEKPKAEPAVKERWAFRNRTFEFGLQSGFYLTNTFLGYGDIFQNPFDILGNLMSSGSFARFYDNTGNYYKDDITINIDDFFSGFAINAGFSFAPTIRLNIEDDWGFGFDIGHITMTGNLLLPESLLGLQKTDGEKFGAGASVFVDFGVPVFFHAGKAKISIRPASYVPLFHLKPGITYAFYKKDGGQRMEVGYDLRIFTPFSLQPFMDPYGDPAGELVVSDSSFGYDFSFGIDYPVSDRVIIGLGLENIPLAPSRLNSYTRLRGEAFFDTGKIDLGSDDPMGDAYGFSSEPVVFGNDGNEAVFRPFTALFHAEYRPFRTQTFALIPSLGFSVNSLYPDIASPEGGISARLDLANILITTVGMNYNDRRWRHSLNFALNLRVLELGLGLSMQSPDFAGSFQGKGLGVDFGLKVGF